MTDELQIGDLILTPEEAAETLAAIRAGRVDGVVIDGGEGQRVFTFRAPSDAHRLLVEAMGEGAALITLEGVIGYHNPKLAELVGEPEGARLRGQTLHQLVPDEEAPEIEALLDQARGGPARREADLLAADGRRVPVQLTASPASVAGVPILCLVVTDLTERRRQEELYRDALVGMQARERLVAVAAHELRNPLATLALQLARLSKQMDRVAAGDPIAIEKMADILYGTLQQSGRLNDLVNQLFDMTLIRAAQLELSIEEVDLAAIVEGVVQRSQEVPKSGSTVTLDVRPVRGFWDRVRLEQVAANLLSNAAKYGLGRPIHVKVEGEARVARLTVEDHGVGIAEEAFPRLFSPFERLPTTRSITGLGLGLYICNEIVRAHGGVIRVESEPGRGSRFIVELPYGHPPPGGASPG